MTAWRNSASPRIDVLLLVLTAGAAFAVTRSSTAWNPTSTVIRTVAETAVALAAAFALYRRTRTPRQGRFALTLCVCAAVAYSFVAELAIRRLTGGGEPLEILILASLHLSAVVLSVFSQSPQVTGAAILQSAIQLLFVTTTSGSRMALVLAAMYGVLILWWLMGAYWDRISGAFVASSVERRIPMRVSVIGGTAIVSLILVGLIGTTRPTAAALRGFIPTSGGGRWHDPYARSGVGDGDALVAAREEAMTFGPVDSELFLDSDMPSLYDMFNEAYGEPPKLKNQERNIGLAPNEPTAEPEMRIATSERSGREFSAVRRKLNRKQQRLDDRKAPAMLYVVGRVPLHLALKRFDAFDGRKWTHSGTIDKRPAIRLETRQEKPWASLMRVASAPMHRGLEPHAVKIINLKTNRFPSPPQLTAVHIDKIDQPDFFGWTDDGIACMPVRKQIPQLTVVHLRSQAVNLQPLRAPQFRLAKARSDRPANRPKYNLPLAEKMPHGWHEVEQVMAWLRTEFVHDPEAIPPEDCQDVVAYFLKAKRGPAYLFATTAAVALRDLGYETRFVTGFYARADRFDHQAGQTRVLKDDVHVWLEVAVDRHHWVTLEPTPGYDPPRESLTWRQWAAKTLFHCFAWARRNVAGICAAMGLTALLLLTRRIWLDAFALAACRLLGSRSPDARLLWTIRLLEWRAWLAGRPRPQERTVSAWYGSLLTTDSADDKRAFDSFLDWVNLILYAPAKIDPSERAAIDAVCRLATATCTPQHFAKNDGQHK